jgi:hypothetical protein
LGDRTTRAWDISADNRYHFNESPHAIRWIGYASMLAAIPLEPAVALSMLLFVEPSLNDSPLHLIATILICAGGSFVAPIMAAGLLMAAAMILALVVWLPFMALRDMCRRYGQRRLPYEHFSKAEKFDNLEATIPCPIPRQA